MGSGQYAGGGGIQGLERGTKSRLGLVIETKQDTCPKCTKKTKWDRWTGETQTAAVTSSIPEKLQKRIFELYKYTDVIEQRKREAQKLIIDHRFPMNRWGGAEDKNPSDMEEEAIRAKFQLLKKDDDGNHNLLKSRACENCVKTGKRGKPFGIPFMVYCRQGCGFGEV